MTNKAAGRGEGLKGLVAERDKINVMLAEFSAKGRNCYDSMPYVVGKRDGINCAIAALEAAAPPSTAQIVKQIADLVDLYVVGDDGNYHAPSNYMTPEQWTALVIGLEEAAACLPAVQFQGHRLLQLTCNHEEKTDTVLCECGWQETFSSCGAAFDGWLSHVSLVDGYRANDATNRKIAGEVTGAESSGIASVTYPCGTIATGVDIPQSCPVHGAECETRVNWSKKVERNVAAALATPSPQAGAQDIESLAATIHAIYQAEARRQGDVRHKDAYADLPENTKEFDRVIARYVLLNFEVPAATQEPAGSGALREALTLESATTIAETLVEEFKKLQRGGYTHWHKASMGRMLQAGVNAALSLSSPIEPPPRPASERHPNSGRDKLAGEAIRELGAIEAEKPKALKWLIKWDQAKKLHPSQDVCVADLAALLVRGPQASSEIREARPKVVCLCGSTRFRDAWVKHYREESLAGKIVLSVGVMVHAGDEPIKDGPIKVMLDELHKRKIDLADEVFVLNVGGYIGSSTRGEIDYAEAHNKPVRYLEALAPSRQGAGTSLKENK